MKKIFLLLSTVAFAPIIHAQIDHSILFNGSRDVEVFDGPNFTGTSMLLKPGTYPLSRFNDMASSIKVAPGMVAVFYESYANNKGFGLYVDLLEDCADLSAYNLDNKLSFVSIFYLKKDVYIYARGKNVDGQYVPGHWERERVNGAKPDNNPPPVVGTISVPAAVNTKPSATRN